MDDDRFGVRQEMCFKIPFESPHMMRIQPEFHTSIMVIQQGIDVAVLLTVKIMTGRRLIKKKNLRNLSRRPTPWTGQ